MCQTQDSIFPDPSTPTELRGPEQFLDGAPSFGDGRTVLPGDDGSKVVGISKLKYPESLRAIIHFRSIQKHSGKYGPRRSLSSVSTS
ncbi:hypothetical protein Pst134EA_031637 [Puccinia striiformis f. sp. tritici]|uniref:uncharacterized protein n=1 Tax=Puccinia striiformis f. sp. tritici TaxID=168172 RepID=UPI002008D7AE|nr:uncharacterized protein Pst134EA_031637 [Puccinia striiformis f. sp. tritici]KAH9442704.1 hypothetical protein Pst134EA_031637 [Puccinia striiformis f. sp. tritici]